MRSRAGRGPARAPRPACWQRRLSSACSICVGSIRTIAGAVANEQAGFEAHVVPAGGVELHRFHVVQAVEGLAWRAPVAAVIVVASFVVWEIAAKASPGQIRPLQEAGTAKDAIYFKELAIVDGEGKRIFQDTDAEALGKQLEGVTVSFHRRSGEHDQLFGSVTSGDIAAELAHRDELIDKLNASRVELVIAIHDQIGRAHV